MEKPLTIRVKEIEEQLIKVINESGLPPFILLNIMGNITSQIQEIDTKEVNDYIKEQNMKKVKKGSDK